ncbi:MAG: tRNA (adenosine(37)-N6)-threonylcarbamoyltransferase complex dimerization subunit type 1 TsaB [Bacteroidia bacterium]
MSALILNIETATTACSVCLAQDDVILTSRELNNGYSHSENLHVFIDEVLKQAGVRPSELNAVAVSKGPGSYTGLRIGVSAAKGLCYSLSIPLIGVNTLQSMSAGMTLRQKSVEALYCPMLDARRMEVYCALYDENLKEVIPTCAKIIDENSILEFSRGKKVFFFGDGAEKCKEFIAVLPDSTLIPDVFPSALQLAKLSFEAFRKKESENVAYFEPYYLKEFLGTKAQNE